MPHLTQIVQHNCHIADARFGSTYSMCVYLMKMREYYRWERGIPLSQALPKVELGEWLGAREQLWESLENQPFSPIPIRGCELDPFAAEAINAALIPGGLIYSAGLGVGSRPHFLLGVLEREEHHAGCRVFVAGREHARDLAAPPAMALGKTIFLRRECLRRLVWERVESWLWSRPDNAMGRLLEFYDLERDPEGTVTALAERELHRALLHELGEAEAGRRLGADWERLLVGLPRSRVELTLRAVRDHLADCVSTIPALVQENDPVSVHAYFAGLDGVREHIFPSLTVCYRHWLGRDGDLSVLRECAERGAVHWLGVGREALAAAANGGAEAMAALERITAECGA